jgi:hypothetical protein
MIRMEMGYEYPLYVADGPAYGFQRFLKNGKGLRRIHARIKKRNAAVMYEREHMDVLQPEGHGQRYHVKTFSYLFNQPSSALRAARISPCFPFPVNVEVYIFLVVEDFIC